MPLRSRCFILQVYFKNLRNSYSLLGHKLRNPTVVHTTFLRVSKVLTVNDLAFPILINKGEGNDGFILELDSAVSSCKQKCELSWLHVIT